MGNRNFRPILTAISLLSLCGPVAAGDGTAVQGTAVQSVVDYLDSQPLSLAEKDSRVAITVPLRNGSSAPAAYRFTAFLKDRYDHEIAVSIEGGDGMLPALEERFVTLNLKVQGNGVP